MIILDARESLTRLQELDYQSNMKQSDRSKLHKDLKQNAEIEKPKGVTSDQFVDIFKGLM